jgi:trk system potassium uptake protein TrkA
VTLKERTDALSGASIFAGLSHRSVERIARSAKEFEAPAGQVLIEGRTPGSGMFVVIDGVAEVDLRSKGTREVARGECFGELSLLIPGGLRVARVRAKTPMRCIAIGRDDFRKILVSEPKVALGILETLAVRLAAEV